jgi:hypothetical protein
MSLRPLQATMPLGQFDGLDSQLTSVKGGEVVCFSTTAVPPGDKAASDAFDGYVPPTNRPVVQFASDQNSRPLMLADDGIAGYGTLFGTVVGGTVGQVSTGGTVLGPHTATGSGKITCWAQPGLYAVSLDAVDGTAGGLLPSNALAVPGVGLYYTAAGLLTLSANKVSSAPRVGTLVEFTDNGSLVTTPNYLTQALNSPSGSSALVRTYTFAVIYFAPPTA